MWETLREFRRCLSIEGSADESDIAKDGRLREHR